MNGEDGVADVVPIDEEGLEFRLIQDTGELSQRLGEVVFHTFAFPTQFQKDLQLLFCFKDAGEVRDGLIQPLLALLESLILLLVLPDFLVGKL
jgi:hypothetical protein